MENKFEEVTEKIALLDGLNFRYCNFLIQRLVDPLGGGIHHYRVSRYGSDGATGTGSDVDKVTALKKAFAEFCERCALKNLSSNGFASHPSKIKAKTNSYYEIIERDLVITSWLAKIPPTWLTDQQIETLTEIQLQVRILRENNFLVRLGIVGISANVIVCIGTLQPLAGCKHHFFNLFSSASGGDLEKVATKIMFDLRRSVGFLSLPENERVIAIDQLNSPFDHTKYYAFNPQSKAEFDWYYDHSGDQNVRIFDDVGDVKYIEHPNPYFDDVPYYIYQAVPASGTFQDYFAGIPNAQKINFNRLRQMGITDLSSINSSPHPLG